MEETLYDRILKLCTERGISLNTLCDESELGRGTISRWRTRIPRTNTLQKVAKVLQVDVDYLLGNTPYKNQEEMYKDLDQKYDAEKIAAESRMYDAMDKETAEMVHMLKSNKKLKDMFNRVSELPESKIDAIYNMVIAMTDSPS